MLSYESPLSTPESILAIGAAGVGKTASVLSIADRLPDREFYVTDIDWAPSYERLIQLLYPNLTNVHVDECDPEDWEEIIGSLERNVPKLRQNDWLVVDSCTHPWAAVQSFYVERTFGADIGDYFLEVRKRAQRAIDEGKDLKDTEKALEGWRDWDVINKNYRKLYRQIRRAQKVMRANVYMTAESESLSKEDRKDSDVDELYGAYGVKPRGQKQLGFVPQTVLWIDKASKTRRLTTIKDRGRDELYKSRFEDFFDDYMLEVAGWGAVVS